MDHITLITNKILKNLGIISRIKHCLPFHVLLNLYYTLIFPYLSYCNIVWGSNYPFYLLHLVILQKRIIRIVCNLPYLASTETCFTNLNILTLDNKTITKSFYSCFGSTLINIPDLTPFPSLLDHKYMVISQDLRTI